MFAEGMIDCYRRIEAWRDDGVGNPRLIASQKDSKLEGHPAVGVLAS